MRNYFYLFTAMCLFVPAASATPMTFQTPGSASDKDGTLDATVTFTILNSNLYIGITNNEANPKAAGQLISDLSFVLSGGLTAGSLSSSISSTVGSSSSVSVLDSSFNSSTTTTTPSTWQLSHGSADCGTGASTCYFLNDLTGGQPENMIIGPGPYTNYNSSITNFAPSLAGTVVFEVTGITGLSSSTTVSSVNMSFGTGPDKSYDLVSSPTPEPFSFVLMGSGLVLLSLLGRKRKA